MPMKVTTFWAGRTCWKVYGSLIVRCARARCSTSENTSRSACSPNRSRWSSRVRASASPPTRPPPPTRLLAPRQQQLQRRAQIAWHVRRNLPTCESGRAARAGWFTSRWSSQPPKCPRPPGPATRAFAMGNRGAVALSPLTSNSSRPPPQTAGWAQVSRATHPVIHRARRQQRAAAERSHARQPCNCPRRHRERRKSAGCVWTRRWRSSSSRAATWPHAPVAPAISNRAPFVAPASGLVYALS